MIRSMTGYGAAEEVTDDVRIAVEIRSVNNRFLKTNQRLPDGMGSLEVTVDRLLRDRMSRGTVTLTLTVVPRGAAARAPINRDLLEAYYHDVCAFGRETVAGFQEKDVRLDALLALPGVVGSEQVLLTGIADLPERIEAVVIEAVDRLTAMRDAEGHATGADMAATLDAMERHLRALEARVPAVIEEYRARLLERVKAMIEGVDVPPDDQTLIREVAFYAERSDINEEVSRLASHIAQFRDLLAESGPAGRKLEFVTQEMYREVNTIGSKANDSEISREVVEIKVGVDRLREQSQNVE
ncbi:MAG: YicC family protein [Planctomycetes bacterium]|nr:YicC family protein [Planctomycetota bacterium]